MSKERRGATGGGQNAADPKGGFIPTGGMKSNGVPAKESLSGGRLPEDMRQELLWIVRGQARRCSLPEDRLSEADLQRKRAVQGAEQTIGQDIRDHELQQKLRRAMLLNISSGRAHPFERLGLSFLSRSDFFRRRERFLAEVAKRLGLF